MSRRPQATVRGAAHDAARRAAVAAAALVAATVAACRPGAPPAPAPAPAAPRPEAPAEGAAPAAAPDQRPVVRPGAGAAAAGDSATVAEVLDGALRAGRVVRVAGRCLGYGSAAQGGPPPRTRSDWLLGDADRAVYVVGALPPGCDVMSGAPGRVTVRGRVAVDTVEGLRGPGAPRRYLVRLGDGRGA